VKNPTDNVWILCPDDTGTGAIRGMSVHTQAATPPYELPKLPGRSCHHRGPGNQLTETVMVLNLLSWINLHFDPKEDAGGQLPLKSVGGVDESSKQTRGPVR
jgi:hypothetical protein